MINTILIVICTVINCVWGFYWIRHLQINYKENKEREKRKRHIELCLRCVEVGSCPHNCEVCAWGDYMTEKQLNQEKEVRKFWKNILKKN